MTFDDGYRSRQKRIALPQDAKIPEIPQTISDEEQAVLLSLLTSLWTLIDVASAKSQNRIGSLTTPTIAERTLGWKRWVLSHQYFLPLLALIGYCMSKAAAEFEHGHREPAREWAELAARQRRGCAALFLYGLDFRPCATIYCHDIRNKMPPAFTGYEIRERQQAYQPGVEAFYRAFPKDHTDWCVVDLRTKWAAADMRYRELHERCMVQAVPIADGRNKPESLRAGQIREQGFSAAIGDSDYTTYDNWFGVERRADMTWLDYAYEVGDVIERLCADLLVGHRLEPSVFAELLDSMRATLTVFARWGGSVKESSPFYPKQLRGE